MTGKKIILQIPLLWLFLFALPANGSEFIQVAGLIDTRTTHSDGSLSVDALAELARSRGFEVLVLNDHDRLAMAYGDRKSVV